MAYIKRKTITAALFNLLCGASQWRTKQTVIDVPQRVTPEMLPAMFLIKLMEHNEQDQAFTAIKREFHYACVLMLQKDQILNGAQAGLDLLDDLTDSVDLALQGAVPPGVLQTIGPGQPQTLGRLVTQTWMLGETVVVIGSEAQPYVSLIIPIVALTSQQH